MFNIWDEQNVEGRRDKWKQTGDPAKYSYDCYFRSCCTSSTTHKHYVLGHLNSVTAFIYANKSV